MTIIKLAIKMALANVVVCSRTNGSKESHEYADRMGETVRKAITDNLKHILKEPDSLKENIQKLISDIEEG